jgi:hypothetical protein
VTDFQGDTAKWVASSFAKRNVPTVQEFLTRLEIRPAAELLFAAKGERK